MDTTQRLAAIEDIKTLKARYWRLVDTKDWQGLLDTVFVADLACDFTAAGGAVFTEATAVTAMLDESIGDAVTAHMGGPPEIEIRSATDAAAIWPFNDRLVWSHGVLTGAGHYHETYRRTDDGWRIASTTLTRLYQDYAPTPPT